MIRAAMAATSRHSFVEPLSPYSTAISARSSNIFGHRCHRAQPLRGRTFQAPLCSPPSGEINPRVERRSSGAWNQAHAIALPRSQSELAALGGTSLAIAIRGGGCEGARGRDRALRLPVIRLRPRTFVRGLAVQRLRRCPCVIA